MENTNWESWGCLIIGVFGSELVFLSHFCKYRFDLKAVCERIVVFTKSKMNIYFLLRSPDHKEGPEPLFSMGTTVKDR